MRIGILQFNPQVGDIDNNLNRADAVLSKANPKKLDLLVLPEMAFSGYNFRSLQHISPYLEPTTAGISSLWARTTALKHNCVVTVGYPEKVDVTPRWPTSPEYYNSAIVVNPEGETIANYRKSFLYYTDETWALEGPDGFYDGEIPGLGNTAIGICKWPTKSFERMDLNPYKFEAPWCAWEFAYHVLHKQANVVILSMAWLTREDARSFSRQPKDPDMDTLSYWLARLEPLIRAETEGEIIVILANRCGNEEEAVYAGTSAVLGIQAGEVRVYGILGRGEKELLVVDTKRKPQAKLVSVPNTAATEVSEANTESSVDSTFSHASDASALTVDTNVSSSTPDRSITDLVTPITPADPVSANAYFARRNGKGPDPETLQDELKSSIAPANPNSPTFGRTPSPKSRNASRTREPVEREPARFPPDFSDDQVTPRSIGGAKSPRLCVTPPTPSSPAFNRPPSPKSRNVSRTRESGIRAPARNSSDPTTEEQESPISPSPRSESRTREQAKKALARLSHDLATEEQLSPKPQEAIRTQEPAQQAAAQILCDFATEEQVFQGSIGGAKSPPAVTQSVRPEHYSLLPSIYPSGTFGTLSQHIHKRRKSTLW